MSNQVTECGGLGWTGVCGTAGSEPADRVSSSAAYRALGAPQRAVVDALLDAKGDDRALCDGLFELVCSRGFRTLDAGDQGRVLLALADRPTGEAADRLRHLAADPGFRAFPTDEQAERAAKGRIVGADRFFRASGAEGPPRHGAGLGPIGIALHASEVVAEASEVVVAATIASSMGLLLLAVEMAHGIHEAYVDGSVWHERVGFGLGFAGRIADNLGDPAYHPTDEAAADGARVADLVWDTLEPSERATLLTLPPDARAELAAELTRLLERRTIGGE